ncbi:MAG: hypothetical protein DDT39_00925 [Firmicutes bacterium]|nr:hypothetical protein [candidate division NPL-UPA2 bacterium]
MDAFYANPDKQVAIAVNGRTFFRHAIRTHFVTPREDYLEIIRFYASALYQPGDILSISEKVIALCQNRILEMSEIRLSFWARLLSRFVNMTPAGESVGNPYKMQIAINLAGLPRILLAAACAAITRPFGIKGVFYMVAGHGIAGIDGFCADAFDWYLTKGILVPEAPSEVCREIKAKLGMDCMIVDANDLGVTILGHSDIINFSRVELMAMLRDNPAGQGSERTPLVLIRPGLVVEQRSAG